MLARFRLLSAIRYLLSSSLRMSYIIRDWLNLGLRWFHVFAAIMWVGQTFFFTWLDRRFHSGEKNVWMVHSGGFYIVDVPDLDSAIEWAARCPLAPYGSVEVRPIMEIPPQA